MFVSSRVTDFDPADHDASHTNGMSDADSGSDGGGALSDDEEDEEGVRGREHYLDVG